MKIVKLKSENFKKLSVEVELNGKSVKVTGKNGAGKSTAIDMIWVALTGKQVPEMPIKTGEESAKIEVELIGDDGEVLIVEKRFNPSGPILIVKTPQGARYPSPQDFLDKKLGNISFDPFAFISKKPMEKKKFLMEFLGIDITPFEAKKKTLLAEKNAISVEITGKESEISSIEEVTEEVVYIDPATVIKEMNDLNELKTNKTAREGIVTRHKTAFEQTNYSIIDTEGKIEALINSLKEAEKEKEELQKERDRIIMQIEITQKAVDEIIIPEAINYEVRLEEINANNKKVEAIDLKARKRKELQEIILKAEAKAVEIKAVEKERSETIAAVKMPLEGLEFAEDGLLLNGLPFEKNQINTAKIMEVGIGIQKALAPKCSFVRIKDASLLDTETKEFIKAQYPDAQILWEEVSDSAEVGFIIEG